MIKKFCAFVVLLTLLSNNSIYGHKILVIVTMHGKSHWSYMKVFIDELLNRGNEITCITSVTFGDGKPDNYTEILIDPPYSKKNLSKVFYKLEIPITVTPKLHRTKTKPIQKVPNSVSVSMWMRYEGDVCLSCHAYVSRAQSLVRMLVLFGFVLVRCDFIWFSWLFELGFLPLRIFSKAAHSSLQERNREFFIFRDIRSNLKNSTNSDSFMNLFGQIRFFLFWKWILVDSILVVNPQAGPRVVSNRIW